MKKLVKIVILYVLLMSFLMSSSIIRSMILPGWGELVEYKSLNKEYIKKRSNILMIAELSIISGYFVSNQLTNSYEDDYESYGKFHAEINWDDKNAIYAINVGRFDDLYAYNEFKSDIGQYDAMYPLNQGYEWSWDSDQSRKRYSNIRNKSATLKDTRTLMIAGLLLNRLVSFFDLINIKKNEQNSFSLSVDNDIKNNNVNFNIKF